MTKLYLTIVALLQSMQLFTQNEPVGTKDYLAPSPEKNTELSVRNPNAIDMIINGVSVDKRVLQYYGSDDMNDVPVEKLKSLNRIYVSSFQLITPKNILSEKCINYIDKDLNLGKYNHLRLKTQRKEISVNYENCLFKISLFSWDEINNSK
jgi:hypothetical protein